MVEFFTTNGIRIDLIPNQELALTIEHAFLSNDGIPVAWTTDVELAATERNCRLFGFPNSMLIPSQKKQINVVMQINGIPTMPGKLKLLGPASNMLRASFSGVEIESSLTGHLKDVAFDKWNFGKLGDYDDKTLYNEVMSSAANGTREDFATPCMIRSEAEDVEEPYIDLSSVSTKESWATKFCNAKIGTFTIPVVRLKYILRKVFPDCEIDKEFEGYIDKIGIVAPYRKNGSFADIDTGCLDKDEAGNYVLDLAEAMPDITVLDFMKNLLNAFGATVYLTQSGKQIIANKTILESTEFENWTNKISDDFEQEYEDGRNYEFGFSGVNDTEIKEPVVDCATIGEAFNLAEGTVAHALDTGDYYRVLEKHIRLGISAGESTGYRVAALKLLKQGGMEIENISENDLETVSATCSFTPVRTLPYHFHTQISWAIQGITCMMIPIVEIPSVGGARPTNVFFGTLERVTADFVNAYAPLIQLTSTGCYGDGSYWISFFYSDGRKLTMNDENGLYQFHIGYKKWLLAERTITKAALNLAAGDIANLKIWKKIMLYNQLFLIKTLTITLNTSKDYINTEAEFVPV